MRVPASARLGVDSAEIVDAYDPMMFARAVKTEHEVTMLRRATALNQAAIERTVASWERGMRWREFNHAYHRAVADLLGADDPECVVFGQNMTSLTFAISRALARDWKPGDCPSPIRGQSATRRRVFPV